MYYLQTFNRAVNSVRCILRAERKREKIRPVGSLIESRSRGRDVEIRLKEKLKILYKSTVPAPRPPRKPRNLCEEMAQANATRKNTFAGSWYCDNPTQLGEEIVNWFDGAEHGEEWEDMIAKGVMKNLKACIAPHAGLAYSGSTAASVYARLIHTEAHTVFILGPSHRKYMENQVGVTQFAKWNTTFGPIDVDRFDSRRLVTSGPGRLRPALPAGRRGGALLGDADASSARVRCRTGNPYKIVPLVVGSLDAQAALATVVDLLTPHFLRDGRRLHRLERFLSLGRTIQVHILAFSGSAHLEGDSISRSQRTLVY